MTNEEEFEDAKKTKAEFDAVMQQEFGQYEDQRTSKDIMREIVALEEEKYNIENSFAAEKLRIDFFKKEEEELKKKLDEYRQKRYAEEAKTREGERKAAEIKEKVSRLQRDAHRLQEHERANTEFAAAAQAFLDGCITRPWFGKALPHQIWGAQSLAYAQRGFCGDYMGLGKTLLSLIWADFVKAKRVLVLAPKETCYSFINEIGKWADDRIVLDFIAKPKAYRDGLFMGAEAANLPQFIIVANFETWRKDKQFIDDVVKIMKVDAVIIDEAHSIKNKKSNVFRGISEIVFAQNQCVVCKGVSFSERLRVNEETATYWNRTAEPYYVCNSCDHGTFDIIDTCSVKYLLCMTGTPILNKPQELWPILFLIDPKTYGSEKGFLEDFCWYDPYNKKYYFQYGGIGKLAKRIGKRFIMRDYESAGIKIPEQQIHEYVLDFNQETAPDQWKAYQVLAQHDLLMVTEDSGYFVKNALARMTRQRQMVTWPQGIKLKDREGNVYYECQVRQSIKVERAETLARELMATGERVIIFSQFKEPLKELHRRLNGTHLDTEDENARIIKAALLDGETTREVREAIRHDFDKSTREDRGGKYRWDLLLCNYKVGGQSSTFTEAIHTIILDEEWNPGKRDQAYGRTHRIGQDRETIVHLIKLRNDDVQIIDEYIASLISDKEVTTTSFEKATKDSTAELIEILKKTVKGL